VPVSLSFWLLETVWRLQETHHQVAIKSVRRDILTAKLFDNLQSEIEILKSLSHRHITKLIDIVVSAPSLSTHNHPVLRCVLKAAGLSVVLFVRSYFFSLLFMPIS